MSIDLDENWLILAALGCRAAISLCYDVMLCVREKAVEYMEVSFGLLI